MSSCRWPCSVRSCQISPLQRAVRHFLSNRKSFSLLCRCCFTRFFCSSKPCGTAAILWIPVTTQRRQVRLIIHSRRAQHLFMPRCFSCISLLLFACRKSSPSRWITVLKNFICRRHLAAQSSPRWCSLRKGSAPSRQVCAINCSVR